MKDLNRRRLGLLGLVGYVSLAGILALLPASLPIPDGGLPYAFALEAMVLGVGGLYIWRRAHRLVAAMAYRDEMTGLGNRRAFNERAAELPAEQRGGSTGIVLFDVDGLKNLNDECGHQSGDELLAIVGRRLNAAKGDSYRIGGDEFAVIIDRDKGQSALPVLRRLEPFNAAFLTCGHCHGIRLSFGFASALQDEDFASLFARADLRLRQFKRELYTDGVLPDRRVLEAEAALEDGALRPTAGESRKRGRGRGRMRLLG